MKYNTNLNRVFYISQGIYNTASSKSCENENNCDVHYNTHSVQNIAVCPLDIQGTKAIWTPSLPLLPGLHRHQSWVINARDFHVLPVTLMGENGYEQMACGDTTGQMQTQYLWLSKTQNTAESRRYVIHIERKYLSVRWRVSDRLILNYTK